MRFRFSHAVLLFGLAIGVATEARPPTATADHAPPAVALPAFDAPAPVIVTARAPVIATLPAPSPGVPGPAVVVDVVAPYSAPDDRGKRIQPLRWLRTDQPGRMSSPSTLNAHRSALRTCSPSDTRAATAAAGA